MSNQHLRIRSLYLRSPSEATDLFQAIIQIAEEIGLAAALAYLEQCVIEKRLSWVKANFDQAHEPNHPVWAGYHWFYEQYLGVQVPEDGEIVEHTDQQIVMRWWNSCPTLDVCEKLGLDTREICKQVYQKPVQEFLRQINPQLRFDRNYERIRPYAPYCEEIIFLEE